MADEINKRDAELGPRMSLMQHLDELRKRLVRAAFAVAICFGVSWGYVDDLMEFLLQPHYTAVANYNKTIDQKQILRILKSSKEASTDKQSIEAFDKWIDSLETSEWDVALVEAKKNYASSPNVMTSLETAEKKINAREKVELDRRPTVISYTESMMTYFKAALIVSLLVAGPYVLWELWGFIAAGLYIREKKFINQYFPLALFLFFSGIAIGYFFMIPMGLSFLLSFGSDLLRPEIRVSDYFSLFLTLTFALGLIFQIPMVMIILSRLGVMEPKAYRSKWRHVLVLCFIISAVATPTFDPVNQTLLAGIMYLLFELGILLAYFAHRDRQRAIEERQQL